MTSRSFTPAKPLARFTFALWLRVTGTATGEEKGGGDHDE